MSDRDEMAAVISDCHVEWLNASTVADALIAAGYGKVDGDADKIRAAVQALIDEWQNGTGHLFISIADLRKALAEPSPG